MEFFSRKQDCEDDISFGFRSRGLQEQELQSTKGVFRNFLKKNSFSWTMPHASILV
jgi:hypothetical protein